MQLVSIFFFLVTFRAVRHYILNSLAKKEAVRNCMLRPRQGNWRLKCAAVQDRALKLYPVYCHLSVGLKKKKKSLGGVTF